MDRLNQIKELHASMKGFYENDEWPVGDEYLFRIADDEHLEWLIQTFDLLIKENGAMAEKHAEKDIAISEFIRIIDSQQERIENLLHNHRVLAAALNKTQVEYHNYRHKYFDADDQH